MMDTLEVVKQVTVLQGLNAPKEPTDLLPYAIFTTQDITPLVIRAKERDRMANPHKILEILDLARNVLNCDGFHGLEFTKLEVCNEIQRCLENNEDTSPAYVIPSLIKHRDQNLNKKK